MKKVLKYLLEISFFSLFNISVIAIVARAESPVAIDRTNSDSITLSVNNLLVAEAPVVENTIPALNPIPLDRQIRNLKSGAMSQITNVSQLSDISPGDWAYEALQSLVERYGCIAGYPDNTFRGNRALTRYEFAAGLNACLQQIESLIYAGASPENPVIREDVETLRRLTQKFTGELATDPQSFTTTNLMIMSQSLPAYLSLLTQKIIEKRSGLEYSDSASVSKEY